MKTNINFTHLWLVRHTIPYVVVILGCPSVAENVVGVLQAHHSLQGREGRGAVYLRSLLAEVLVQHRVCPQGGSTGGFVEAEYLLTKGRKAEERNGEGMLLKM